MSSKAEQNKALVHRFFEARVKLDLDALEKMLADDFVSHTRGLPGQQLDREGYKRMSLEFAAAFSNSRFIVEEQVAEAEKVVSRFTVHATHDGREFLGHMDRFAQKFASPRPYTFYLSFTKDLRPFNFEAQGRV